MEGEDFADAVLANGGLQGELSRDVAGLYGIALHKDFAVAQEVVVHHAGSNDGDDHAVVADDATVGGFRKGELVCERAVNLWRIHGIDEPGVAFLVALAEVVMARSGGEEEPLFDREVCVFQRKAEVDAFAPGGLVGLVEDREVEGFARLHRGGDDVGGLIGGKDELHAVELGSEKLTHLRAVGGDGEVEFAGAQNDFIAPCFDGWVGADAQVGQHRPRRFPRPFVQCLPQQGERGDKDEDWRTPMRSATQRATSVLPVPQAISAIARSCSWRALRMLVRASAWCGSGVFCCRLTTVFASHP